MRTLRNKNKLMLRSAVCMLLIVCTMLTTVSIFALEGTIDPASAETVDVVVLVEDIKVGTKITAKQLEIKTVKNKNIPDNVISDKKEVEGLYAKIPLYAGDYVYREQLTDEASETGEVNNDLLYQNIKESTENFVYVTDYFPANTGKDVAALIQDVIDKNPLRTIYFPDGEYIISKPIVTPSDGDKSVSLHLSEGAVIKADKSRWQTVKGIDQKGNGYTVSSLIGLGAKGVATNNNRKNGSYFYLAGGTLDGNGVANGVSLEQGRETLVRNIVIKNFKQVGLSIPRGTNSSSSDDDIEDVIIIGNGALSTVGVSLIGYDNTLTNIRIYNCERGLDMGSGGNVLRNINVYYDPTNPACTNLNKKYMSTMGINETNGGNFLFHCYVENCATGIKLDGSTAIDSCKVVWNQKPPQNKQVAYAGKMKMSACSAYFYDTSGSAYIESTSGVTIEAPILNDSLCSNKTYKNATKFSKAVVPVK